MVNFSFIQMADPQFGMFAGSSGKTDKEIAAMAERGNRIKKVRKFKGFKPETALFTRAIERANWLKPAFVVICGDMVNNSDDDEQIAEVKRIAALLDDSIDLRYVAGNHDVAVDHTNPTAATLERYRDNFGPDYYAFSYGDVRFVVINSTVFTATRGVAAEAKAQLAFLESEAIIAGHQNANRIVLLSHHPLFIESADEDNNPWSITKKYRKPLLEIAADHGIKANFAGHLHRNNVVSENGLLVVASGPVGLPLADDPSGFRVVTIGPKRINHKYHSLETE
jgi:predicted phosphodiesterase